MTPAKWEDPVLSGFSVTVPDGLTIRIDRNRLKSEMRSADGRFVGTNGQEPG